MKKIRVDFRRQIFSTGFGHALHLVRNILVANILGPYWTGLFNSISTYVQVVSYCALGTADSLTVQIPYYRGKKKAGYLEKLKGTIFTFNLGVSVALFIGVCVWVIFISKQVYNIRISIFLCGVWAIFTQVYLFFSSYLSGERRFSQLSFLESLLSILLFVFNIAGTYWALREGYWGGLILSYVIICAVSVYLVKKKEKINYFQFDWTVLKKNLPLSILLGFSRSLYLLFVSLIKVFLTVFSGVTAVGYFLPAIIILSRLSIMTKMIGNLNLPRFSMLNGKTNKADVIYKMFLKTQKYALFSTLPIVVPGVFLVSPMISLFLPRFKEGAGAAILILLAGIPFCLIENANNILLSMKKKRMFFAFLMLALAALLVFLAAFKSRIPILMTSGASLLCAFFVYSLAVNLYAMRFLKMRIAHEKQA